MLNVKPGLAGYHHDDLAVFAKSVTLNQAAGTYYIGPSALVSNINDAARFDVSGKLLLRGSRILSGVDIAGGTVVTVTPMLSADFGDAFIVLPTLEASLAGSTPAIKRRAFAAITNPANYVDIPADSVLIYKVLLTVGVGNNTLTASLIAY